MKNRPFSIHSIAALAFMAAATCLCVGCGTVPAPVDSGGAITSLPTPSATTGGSGGQSGVLGGSATTGNPTNANATGTGTGTGTTSSTGGTGGTTGGNLPRVGAKILAQGAPGLCLDIVAGALTPGTVVQLWGCNALANAQSWQITQGGQVRTTNNRCLDVAGTVEAGASWSSCLATPPILTPRNGFCRRHSRNHRQSKALLCISRQQPTCPGNRRAAVHLL